MDQNIKDLLEVSHLYGADKNYVIAGGGNTSFKNNDILWVKASGHPLATLGEEGLVALNRSKLRMISVKQYSEEPMAREEEVKNDLNASLVDPA